MNNEDLNSFYFSSDLQNDSSRQKKPIQDFLENFKDNSETMIYASDASCILMPLNVISDDLNYFLTSNDADIDKMPVYIDDKPLLDAVKNFDIYENQLDNMEIDSSIEVDQELPFNFELEECDLPSSSELTYFNLDTVLPSITTDFGYKLCISSDTESVSVKSIPAIKQSKNKNNKEKRGRGRPKVSNEKLEERIKEAERTNEKQKIRVTKNNKASKLYRDKKALRKTLFEKKLDIELLKYEKLRAISKRLSEKIRCLEILLQNQTF